MKKNKEIPKELKAGALICPTCFVEYIETKEDFEHEETIVRNVKILRCPVCQEEIFNPEQQKQILKKMGDKE